MENYYSIFYRIVGELGWRLHHHNVTSMNDATATIRILTQSSSVKFEEFIVVEIVAAAKVKQVPQPPLQVLEWRA